MGVLTECYMSSESHAQAILLRVMSSYGLATPLQLAVHSENKEFVSHQCCQGLLTAIWWGELSRSSAFSTDRFKWKVHSTTVCSLLLLLCVFYVLGVYSLHM